MSHEDFVKAAREILLSGHPVPLPVTNKYISNVFVEGDASELVIQFTDGTGVSLVDDGQSCCESRYMTTDDRLEDFIGSALVAAEIKNGPSVGEDEVHETQFLVVRTSKGEFTVVTHNEHNGYYGGFNVKARLL